MNAWKGGLSSQTQRPPAAAPLDSTARPAAAPARAPAAAQPRGLRRFQVWGAAVAVAAAASIGVWMLLHNRNLPPAVIERADSGMNSGHNTASPSTNTSKTTTYRALVVGINRYDPAKGTGWQPLQNARPDAEAIARTLREDYGFLVTTLLDEQATRAAITQKLDELATAGGENDALLIYFAGHGFYDDKLKEGYWIPADARRCVGTRDAKEDWLWNSTLTRLFGAATARHVLVLADACYSGALFRGDQPLSPRGNRSWYERAFARRSRYLITSGGMEKVLDSGTGHSVFAQQILNYLTGGERDIFSASDLGIALRDKVAQLTGQTVQMGPLPVSEHAGGEFVFVRRKAGVQLAALPAADAAAADVARARGPEAAPAAPAKQEVLRDALTLSQAGAPGAAGRLVSVVLQQNAQDQLAQSVAAYLDRTRRQEGRSELQTLITRIEQYQKARAADASKPPAARPRVLACIGPTALSGLSGGEGNALLYRVMLNAELGAHNAARIVEREALASILQEQQISASELADPRARTAIGKLLPASLLLLGDVIPTPKEDLLALRLVDVETSTVLASFRTNCPPNGDVAAACAGLAARIAERLTALRPLVAPVSQADGAKLRAEFGTFQGGRPGMTLAVLARTPRAGANPEDFTEQEIGTATVRTLGDFTADLDAAWTGTPPPRSDNLWVRER
jgi:hypothetical protein